MKILTTSFAAAMLCCTSAWATDPPPKAGATTDAKPKIVQKDTKKQTDKAPTRHKRRAVYQQFDELPVRTPPTAIYAPDLTPRIDPAPLTPPVTIQCVGAACSDNNGGTYRGGVGTTLIGPQGKVCSNNGMTVQCF